MGDSIPGLVSSSISTRDVTGRGARAGGPARDVDEGTAVGRGVPDGTWRCRRDDAFKAGESDVGVRISNGKSNVSQNSLTGQISSFGRSDKSLWALVVNT